MKRKGYPVVSPVGGLDVGSDAALIADLNSPNLKHVRFHKGLIKKEFGFAAHGDCNERAMLFDTYTQYDGTSYQLCCSVDKAYNWTSGAWAAISGAGAVFTGTSDNRFESSTMNDIWMVVNGVDYVQKWDGTTWADLANIVAFGVTTVRSIVTFYSHCVIANITEGGNLLTSRVRWSDTGDPEDWNTGTAGAVDIVDTAGAILTMKVLRDRLFIFKEDSVWELVYVGGTKVFDPRLVLSKGLLCAGSLVVFGNECIGMFTDGFFRFDGLYRTPVAEHLFPLIFETEGKNIRWTALTRTCAEYIEETNDYAIALPEDSDEPNVLYKMNIKDKSWSRIYIGVTALGRNNQATAVSWTAAKALGTAWNHASWDVAWRSHSIPAGAYTLVVGQSDGTTIEDNRATYSNDEFLFETKDFVFSQSVRWKYVIILAKGNPFTLRWSLDQGGSWGTEYTLTPGTYEFSECMKEIEETAMHIRFRIKSTNDQLEVKWIEPTYIKRNRGRNYIRA